jgi:hypothetical protein
MAAVLGQLAHRGLTHAAPAGEGNGIIVLDADGGREEWTPDKVEAAFRAGAPVAAQLWCGPDSDVLLSCDGDRELVFDLDGLGWTMAQAVLSLVLACAVAHDHTLGVLADRHLPDGAEVWRATVVDGADPPYEPDLLLLRIAGSVRSHRLSLRKDSWWSTPTL